MSTQNHKIKINNSYESEASSGSGSSLIDQNDCAVTDEKAMQLPYLFKPPYYITELNSSDCKDDDQTTLAMASLKLPLVLSNTPPCKSAKPAQSRHGIPLHSSQESSFEGFGDSPCDKLQQQLYAAPTVLPPPPQVKLKSQECAKRAHILFARFYDMVVEENSCNAVDIQLSKEPATALSHDSDKEEQSYSVVASIDHATDAAVTIQKSNASSELSFNGKIKSLTTVLPPEIPKASVITDTNKLLEQQQHTESIALKKYCNERSPDLFFDDDDDDEEDANNGQRALADETHNWESASSFVGVKQKQLDDDVSNVTQSKEKLDTSTSNRSINCPTESRFADEQTQNSATQNSMNEESLYRKNCRREKELLRRIRKCLAGVPPPPSLTIPQLDMFNAVLCNKQKILDFLSDAALPASEDSNSAISTNSLFKPTHSLEEAKTLPWRDVLGVRQHGFCYNLSRASESNEYLGLSVIERFIGAETASSYRNSPSSAKKRSTRMKLMAQSPGNRLSHLAKRRSIFSSANLATTSQRANNSLGPQILLDKKKNKHRRKATPKRRTPGSKSKTRSTPSSSARKHVFRNDLMKPGPSRETSKRALFQSPAKHLEQRHSQPKPCIKPEIATRVEKSKRALFSPDKLSQHLKLDNSSQSQYTNTISSNSALKLDSLLKRKRQVVADDDAEVAEFAQSSKLFRGSAENLTPRALKIKSQSFCIGAGSSSSSIVATTRASMVAAAATRSNQSLNSSGNTLSNNKIQRANSDMVAQTNSLTENQRKKLLWAVSQALQEKKITTKHESFKQYAAVLARVVRRIFQEYYQKSSTSNSETMLRLAKRYVYHVINGKNADDIYLQAKAQIVEEKRKSSLRLSGYIGPEEYLQRKNLQQQQHALTKTSCLTNGSLQNLFSTECSMDALSLSISHASSSSAFNASVTSSNTQSQSTQELITHKQPIQVNPALRNSSSKNNLCGFALRENVNVDGEQRRSAQKNFTGKDQRNVSPYAPTAMSSGTTARTIGSVGKSQSTQATTELSTIHGSEKVKRQITFDN